MRLSFTVYGIPQPQGSAKAFYVPKLKRAVITSDNAKLKPWRQEVTAAALAAMNSNGVALVESGRPVHIEARFIFQKPKSARKHAFEKTTKPDMDKLLRALFDALTGSVFDDDAQVTKSTIEKLYGMPSRAEITVLTN